MPEPIVTTLRRTDARLSQEERDKALAFSRHKRLCRTLASMAVTMAMEQGGARERSDADTLAEEQIEGILDLVRARYARGNAIVPAGATPVVIRDLPEAMAAIGQALGLTPPAEPASSQQQSDDQTQSSTG